MVAAKTRNKIVDTFLKLIAEHGYENVTLMQIAEASGVKPSDLRGAFDGKVAIIEAFARQIDAEILDNIDEDVGEELPRERLMDILLSRFDALAPHKSAVEAIFKAAKQDLSLAAQLNRVVLVSMTWLINAANIRTSGTTGAFKVQGVAMVYSRVLRVWLKDDETMAKTMAALDKELRAGERMMQRLNRVQGLLAPLKRMKTRRNAKPVTETADA